MEVWWKKDGRRSGRTTLFRSLHLCCIPDCLQKHTNGMELMSTVTVRDSPKPTWPMGLGVTRRMKRRRWLFNTSWLLRRSHLPVCSLSGAQKWLYHLKSKFCSLFSYFFSYLVRVGCLDLGTVMKWICFNGLGPRKIAKSPKLK